MRHDDRVDAILSRTIFWFWSDRGYPHTPAPSPPHHHHTSLHCSSAAEHLPSGGCILEWQFTSKHGSTSGRDRLRHTPPHPALPAFLPISWTLPPPLAKKNAKSQPSRGATYASMAKSTDRPAAIGVLLQFGGSHTLCSHVRLLAQVLVSPSPGLVRLVNGWDRAPNGWPNLHFFQPTSDQVRPLQCPGWTGLRVYHP